LQLLQLSFKKIVQHYNDIIFAISWRPCHVSNSSVAWAGTRN
jgi:hypothetical protein